MKEKELSYQREGRKKTVRYATKASMATVNPENLKAYKQYLRSNTIKNKDVINTTFKVYESNFNIFLAYIAENEENFYILDEDFLDENMLDVVENYMAFLQEELGNNKKTINNKIAAVSSFYHWAAKRKKIKGHPFANRLDRMKNAGDEKCALAYDLYVDRLRKYIAQYFGVLNGADAIVFTAGIGENSAEVRASVLDGLTWFGIEVDPEKNVFGHVGDITTAESAVKVFVIPTDEELVMLLEQCRIGYLAKDLYVEADWSHVLSGGEQQRLAFVRALIYQPSWLFLDEATSALDEETEAVMYKLVETLMPDTTIVSIGHRSSLSSFHQIGLFIDKGQHSVIERAL